ncbi:MAG: hypothetical protein EBR82_78375 [Caulobacteraceae bacterium]|nr:hypothetical protein [Caulobacteraceae bacterium]
MSAFNDILGDIKTRLETIVGVPPVVIRSRAILLESDALPTIIVSPLQETNAIDAFNLTVAWDYTVQVTIVQAANRIYSANVAAYLQLREDIRQKLYQPTLLTVTGIIGMEINMQPAFESVMGNVNNYDISGMTITYRRLEARSA